jgi:hypothetical protein
VTLDEGDSTRVETRSFFCPAWLLLRGEIVTGLQQQPTLKGITTKVFDVVEDMTLKTRGPIAAMAAA